MSDVSQTFIAQSRDLLSEYLRKLERCVEELGEEDVWWRGHDEGNSVGNLLLHLSGNVRQWIVTSVGGRGPDTRVRQQEFDQRDGLSRAELLERLKGTLAEADDVLAGLDESKLVESRTIQGYEVTVLEAVYHVVEHFSMHAGQIILLTKLLKRKDLKFYEL